MVVGQAVYRRVVEADQFEGAMEIGGAGVGYAVAGEVGEPDLFVTPFVRKAVDGVVAETVDVRELFFAFFQHDGEEDMVFRRLWRQACGVCGDVVEAIVQQRAVEVFGVEGVEAGNPSGRIDEAQGGVRAQRCARQDITPAYHGGVVVTAEIDRVGAGRPERMDDTVVGAEGVEFAQSWLHGDRYGMVVPIITRGIMIPPLPALWVLDDGRAGHLNQSLGLAEALGNADPEVVALRLKVPAWLANVLPVSMAYHPLPRKLPGMAIATGSRAGRVLGDLKAQKPGLFAVQILKPWMGKYGAYDAVIMPAHDMPPKRPNVCAITGALNRVTKDRLNAEAQRWAKRLSSCPAPRLAVMVGGTSKHGVVTEGHIRALAKQMLALAKAHGMSLLVSTSRRTGEANSTLLAKLLEGQKEVPVNVWRPEDSMHRDNPYFAYLALADAVVVTAESVSMVGEAATAGKPVYVWGDMGKLPRKFRAYLRTLQEQGRARPLPDLSKPEGGKLTLRAPAAGLMDTLMAAGFVRARLRAKGLSPR